MAGPSRRRRDVLSESYRWCGRGIRTCCCLGVAVLTRLYDDTLMLDVLA